MKNQSQVKTKEEKTHCLDCSEVSDRQQPGMTSLELSIKLITQLMSLMEKVNKDMVTPESVKSSCQCAEQIYKIMRLNFDMKKEGF